jgi:two-component system chemotaxis response regulator CheY
MERRLTKPGPAAPFTLPPEAVLAKEIGLELIITDLNMPVMDGLALIRGLRAQAAYKFTPILMLTTESQESKKQEGKAAGATGWIVKPFQPEQLLQVVAKVVR